MLILFHYFYLHQVNGGNGRDYCFHSTCVCLCTLVVYKNSSKMIKAMHFRFDTHVLRDSQDRTALKNFCV